MRAGLRAGAVAGALVLAALLFCASVFCLDAGREAAAEGRPPPRTRRVEALGAWAARRLERASDALAAGHADECLETLDRMRLRSAELNAAERAVLWQTYGFAYGALGRYREAAAAFERALAEGALPEGAAREARFNLAQLYLSLGREREAARILERWMETVESPTPRAHYVFAVALARSGDEERALAEAGRAVAGSAAPPEAWLELLASLEERRHRLEAAAATLERLASRFGRPRYWRRLAGVWSALGRRDRALAALEVAYRAGALRSAADLRALAGLYLSRDVPYKAARLVERGIERGLLPDAAESWELAGEAWLRARSRAAATAAFARAAALSSSGRDDLRLGRLAIEQGRWGEARERLRRALAKGGLRDEAGARLLLGIAAWRAGALEEARAALEAAARDPARRSEAERWLSSLAEASDGEPAAAPSPSSAAGPPPRPALAQ